LAKDSPDCQFEPVKTTGHTQAGTLLGQRAQYGIDSCGIRLQVKEPFHPVQNNRADRNEFIGETHGNQVRLRVPRDLHKARVFTALAGDSNGAKIGSIPNRFDSRYCAARKKIEQLVPVQRRTIPEPKRKLGRFFRTLRFTQLPEFSRRHPIAFLEGDVKSSKAAESAGQGD